MSSTDKGYNRIWAGKAKSRSLKMYYGAREFLLLMDKLRLLPKNFQYDDWPEDLRCYVNRVLGKL
jgi:hypothetical protein